MDFAEFVARKREEARALAAFDVREVTPSIRDFGYYVQTSRGDPALIGELRRRDPLRGELAPALDAAQAAAALEGAGCSALAVLTDPLFGARREDLLAASRAVSFPVLRKDLILGRGQVYESRAFGADAIWLEAEVLSASEMAELLDVARALHMDSVVGAASEAALSRALSTPARIIAVGSGLPLLGAGSLPEALALAAKVPPGRVLLLDAALSSPEEIELLRGKIDAAFLGPVVLAAEDLARRAEEFCEAV
jgi:indole-3-glycerol phosphate synthase